MGIYADMRVFYVGFKYNLVIYVVWHLAETRVQCGAQCTENLFFRFSKCSFAS
jgi:hypothetical protein